MTFLLGEGVKKMGAFDVVGQFEQRLAEYTGAPYVVAVNTCTNALFLALKWEKIAHFSEVEDITIPARTFISVPFAIIQAGYRVRFSDEEWKGSYQLKPLAIMDSATLFTKNMMADYGNTLHCVSFQARKILPIGEGGAILTRDKRAADWLRKARYSGRAGPAFRVEDVDMIGWQMYMTPEKAARGLHLMSYLQDQNSPQEVAYPDLRETPFFREYIKRHSIYRGKGEYE